MFHKEGTKTILFGLIFAAVLLLLTILLWLQKLLQIGAFDISNHLTIFQKSQKNFYKMKTKY
jgi:hypothetical protein